MKKIRINYQTLQNECGSCCIAMLMGFYNYDMSVDTINSEIEAGRDGLNFLQIKHYLMEYNFDVKLYKCSVEEIINVLLPGIALWGNNHYVIIEKIEKNAITIVDPISGREKYKIKELCDTYRGYILTATPKLKKRYSPFRMPLAVKYLKLSNNNWEVIKICSYTIILYCLTLILPMSIEKIVNGITTFKNTSYLISGSLIFIVVYFIVNVIGGRQNLIFGKKLFYDINERFVKKIIDLPYKYFLLHTSGDILFKINSMSTIEGLYTNQILPILLDSGVVLILICYAFTTSSYLTSILLVIIIIAGIILGGLLYNINQAIRRTLKENSKLNSLLVEMVSIMDTVKTTNMGSQMYLNWKRTFELTIKENFNYDYLTNIYIAITGTLSIACPFLFLFLGLGFSSKFDITLGTLLGFYTTATIIFSKETSVFANVNMYLLSVNYFSKVDEVLEQKEEKNGCIKVDSEINIVLKNVYFQYSKYSSYILKNISMSFPARKMIAIVGASGSGKSTLSKLVYGLIYPTQGKVYVNNEDIQNIDMKNLRNVIGVVPQKIVLFNMSIYDNIALGNKLIKLEEIEHVCKIVEIDNDIKQMPMKYNTILNNNGSDLSGGQKQRLAIAQALIKKPKLLILDEATSYLDVINEKNISNRLTDIGCTRIVIAHRLSTIKNADYIYVMDKGEVVESGRHEELLLNGGVYATLYLEDDVYSVKKKEEHL